MQIIRTSHGTNFGLSIPIFILLLLALPGWVFAQQGESESRPAVRRVIFTVVEQHPEFPGGNRALEKYLAANLKYPEEAEKKFRDRTYFANFIITETGAIDSARVLKPVHDVVDAEVVRVITNMPAWTPGKQNGHAVAVRFNIPVRFSNR